MFILNKASYFPKAGLYWENSEAVKRGLSFASYLRTPIFLTVPISTQQLLFREKLVTMGVLIKITVNKIILV